MILPDYLNCDMYSPKAQLRCDVMYLPFGDSSIEYIYNAHLIEHFDFFQGYHVLAEWKRVLAPGGILSVETPNFEALCRELVALPEHERFHLYDQFFGKPWVPGHAHKFLYTPAQLWGILSSTGFKDIVTVPAKRYIGMERICMRMECTK
jgi:predicted SAM-dependent methyltransferase